MVNCQQNVSFEKINNLQDYFQRRHWTCLTNEPHGNSAHNARSTSHEIFSMDEQCRMEFGDGYV